MAMHVFGLKVALGLGCSFSPLPSSLCHPPLSAVNGLLDPLHALVNHVENISAYYIFLFHIYFFCFFFLSAILPSQWQAVGSLIGSGMPLKLQDCTTYKISMFLQYCGMATNTLTWEAL